MSLQFTLNHQSFRDSWCNSLTTICLVSFSVHFAVSSPVIGVVSSNPWAVLSISSAKLVYSVALCLYLSFFSPSVFTARSISCCTLFIVSVDERADLSASKLWSKIKHLWDGTHSASCGLSDVPSCVLNLLFIGLPSRILYLLFLFIVNSRWFFHG